MKNVKVAIIDSGISSYSDCSKKITESYVLKCSESAFDLAKCDFID